MCSKNATKTEILPGEKTAVQWLKYSTRNVQASFRLKINGWKLKFPLWGPACFQGLLLLVSGEASSRDVFIQGDLVEDCELSFLQTERIGWVEELRSSKASKANHDFTTCYIITCEFWAMHFLGGQCLWIFF